MHNIDWRLLAFPTVVLFYDIVEKLLGCLPAGSHPFALCRHIQTVTGIPSTAIQSSFIPTLNCFTSFLTPLTSSLSFDPLAPATAAGNK